MSATGGPSGVKQMAAASTPVAPENMVMEQRDVVQHLQQTVVTLRDSVMRQPAQPEATTVTIKEVVASEVIKVGMKVTIKIAATPNLARMRELTTISKLMRLTTTLSRRDICTTMIYLNNQ